MSEHLITIIGFFSLILKPKLGIRIKSGTWSKAHISKCFIQKYRKKKLTIHFHLCKHRKGCTDRFHDRLNT